MVANFVSRGISKVRELVGGLTEESEEALRERIHQQLIDCAEGLGGEVSTRNRAANLAQSYLSLNDDGRHAVLRMIALEFGPDPQRVQLAHDFYQDAVGTDRQWDAEAGLRAAMRSRRIRILTQFNAIPQGVKFLVDLRADLLRYLRDDKELQALDRELEARLSAWFDVGFLELHRISWQSPAALLEKLVEYEAVHEIRSWQDLKNRLDSDRRCYAFFHPRMPLEPLIFVEVALIEGLAESVQMLLDESAPVLDAGRANTAIFYSISNTQSGLRGVSFGNFLLKRVIEDLQRDFPQLKRFATLSPIPQLRSWVLANPEELAAAVDEADGKALAAHGITDPQQLLGLLQGERAWRHEADLANAIRAPLVRLAARYLLDARRNAHPFDPVARFHLGNGARVQQLNWLGDDSEKGWRQSWGLMVNYLYKPDEIEANVETFARDGKVAAASSVRRIAKR